MSKKHFELVAECLAKCRPEDGISYSPWRDACFSLAEGFSREYERFDAEKFLKACDCKNIDVWAFETYM